MNESHCVIPGGFRARFKPLAIMKDESWIGFGFVFACDVCSSYAIMGNIDSLFTL